MPPSAIALGGCFPRARPQPRRENHSSGLRTRAFPAGVTAQSNPGLVKLFDVILAIIYEIIISNPLTSSGKYTETPTGREA